MSLETSLRSLETGKSFLITLIRKKMLEEAYKMALSLKMLEKDGTVPSDEISWLETYTLFIPTQIAKLPKAELVKLKEKFLIATRTD